MYNDQGRVRAWTVTQEMRTVQQTQVFSGGACNILNASGELLRNTERDSINDWLTGQNIYFFDPQIHPDTHGREYDYATDHKLEIAARGAAHVNLYEVSPRTFGGITSLEIASDKFRLNEPMVIYFSDGDPTRDLLPEHSELGHPLFRPEGIHSSEQAMRAHYHEFIKNANNMRKHLMIVARSLDTLTITFSDDVHEGDIIITPERMHASDLFRAVVQASSNKRTFVTFSGGKQARDSKGNPLLVLPDDPPEIQIHALLDQYVDEGNALRRAIAELISITVFTRVVFTQKSAINALGEVLRARGIIDHQ